MKKKFEEGDLVLFNPKLRLFLGKLRCRWSGPFKVINIFPHGAVEVYSKSPSAFKVNEQHLKPYYVGKPIDNPVVRHLFDPEPF